MAPLLKRSLLLALPLVAGLVAGCFVGGGGVLTKPDGGDEAGSDAGNETGSDGGVDSAAQDSALDAPSDAGGDVKDAPWG